MNETGSRAGARPRSGGRRIRRLAAGVVLLLPSYAMVAYVVLPAAWTRYHRTGARAAPSARFTRTREGIPADPVNVELIGSRAEVIDAMRAAGWVEADRITLRSGFRDARSVLFDRPYRTAPMSTQYLWNRPQDLAFEQMVGRSPRRRHHARFWSASRGIGAPPLWVGAATFDRSVGISRFTGEVMHHIDPQVDREREKLLSDLAAAGWLASASRIEGFVPAGRAKNGGGDWYETDGALAVGVLRAPAVRDAQPSSGREPARSSDRS